MGVIWLSHCGSPERKVKGVRGLDCPHHPDFATMEPRDSIETVPAPVEEADVEAQVARRRRFIEQWAPLSGVAFFGLFVAFIITSFSALDTGDSLEESQRIFEAGFSDTAVWGGVILVFAMLLAWLVFVAELYAALRRVAAGLLSTLILLGGAGFAFLFTAGMTLWLGPLAALSDSKFAGADSKAFAEAYWWLGNVGYGLLAAGALCAGVMIVAASVLALRYRLTPPWAAWAGIAAGVLCWATLGLFFPLFLVPLWTLAAAIVLQLKATRRDELKEAAGLPGPRGGFQP